MGVRGDPPRIAAVGVVGVDEELPLWGTARFFALRWVRGEAVGAFTFDFWLQASVRTIRSFSLRDLVRRWLCICVSPSTVVPSSGMSGRLISSLRVLTSYLPGGKNIVRRCSTIRYWTGGLFGVRGEVCTDVDGFVASMGDGTTVVRVGPVCICGDEEWVWRIFRTWYEM